MFLAGVGATNLPEIAVGVTAGLSIQADDAAGVLYEKDFGN